MWNRTKGNKISREDSLFFTNNYSLGIDDTNIKKAWIICIIRFIIAHNHYIVMEILILVGVKACIC